MIFEDNLQWLECTLSTKKVLSTQRLREVFAADWHLGTNGIFCYHEKYQDYFQPFVDSCEREAVKSSYRAYKYICKDILLFIDFIFLCICKYTWIRGALFMGMLRWQHFTAFPKISKQCCACLLCSDEGSFPLQGTGKYFSGKWHCSAEPLFSSPQVNAPAACTVGMTFPSPFWLKLFSWPWNN